MAKKKETETGKPKKVTFFSKNVSKAFVVPLRDENGKPILKTNALGAPIMEGANPVFLHKVRRFEPVSRDIKHGTLCLYDCEEGSPEYEALMAKAEAGDPDVLTREQYEAQRNPEAHVIAKENEALKAESAAKDDQIAEMHETIKRLSREQEKGKAPAVGGEPKKE